MRPSVAFAFLLATLVTSQVPRAAAESTNPELVGRMSGASITLRARGPLRVFIPASSFTMGSDPDEVENAIEMCKREPLGDENCEKWFGSELEAHEVISRAITSIAPRSRWPPTSDASSEVVASLPLMRRAANASIVPSFR